MVLILVLVGENHSSTLKLNEDDSSYPRTISVEKQGRHMIEESHSRSLIALIKAYKLRMRAVLQSRIKGIYDFSIIYMNMLPCLSLSIFLILHNWSSQSSCSHSGDCSLNLLVPGRKRWVKERAKIEAVIVGRIFPTVLASFSIRIETMFSMLVHCILPYYW